VDVFTCSGRRRKKFVYLSGSLNRCYTAPRTARHCRLAQSAPIIAGMKITPLDVRQRRFAKSFNGYNAKEIQAFLETVADEFESLHKESIRLREEAKDFQAQLEHHRNREKVLQETMVAAQKVSQEIKAAAQKEADIVLANAEQQAEKIVQSAHQKLVQVMEDINELKRQRVQFESQLRGLLDSHAKLLETFRQSTFAEADWERIEDNVTFLAPPKKLNEAS